MKIFKFIFKVGITQISLNMGLCEKLRMKLEKNKY